MAEDDGAVENEVANTSTLPVVYIAAADARLRNMNADFMLVSKFGNFTIFESYIFDCAQYECWILTFSS